MKEKKMLDAADTATPDVCRVTLWNGDLEKERGLSG
jgi:hypothetical protein